MTKYQHLLVAFSFLLLALFEVIVFTDILRHPYMVCLLTFLGCVFGYNLGRFFAKNKYL
jgi:hypothetical protein